MSAGSSYSAQPKVILVIEDSPTQALHTYSLLERSGIQAICATNGRMGLNLAHQVHPDLIVLDVQMPDMNGFRAIKTAGESGLMNIGQFIPTEFQCAIRSTTTIPVHG